MRFYRALKWIRVVVALVFFLALGILFVDVTGIFRPWMYDMFTYLQFTPSILKFINLTTLAAAGFAFVLLLTLLFGRIYCSSICPLGTFQDVLIRLEKKFKIRKRFTYIRTYNWLRFILLGAGILVLVLGSAVVFSWLDPFGNFGKMTTAFARPVLIGLNNIGALILKQFDSYALYHISYKTFNLWPFVFALIVLITLILMTWHRGRLFCNTLCPVGTLLGLVSRFSVFRIKIKESECNSCWRCAFDCKAGCIQAEEKRVDMTRCVGCMNCMTACPKSGIGYKFAWKKNKSQELPETTGTDTGKRKFILNTLLFTLGMRGLLNAQEKIVPTKKTTIPEEKSQTVFPPGGKNIEHFNRFCTACHLCVSACPTQVLQPSFLQYGINGMFQPYLDYHKSFCNYECTKCLDVCPNGALLALPLEEKKLNQLGQVNFIKDNCIVETEGTDCGACSEHCPTKAVYMVPYNGLYLPEINQDICVGCGACEYACPTEPYKAIYVDGNALHHKAKKPEGEKMESPLEEDEFPF
ncbi:MAG: 4Fe-4S binding protein [Bacteroidales bacterium]|nr:4Fe-4S binding protein [Bacteroidales bacterium]MCF8349989.1 4Fe-4S binding protein [Bacteroidales bacterium]MCF8376731.1 4Fe-4S binding protein [Bacteroidales bacterium]